jgi:hypothetical protein
VRQLSGDPALGEMMVMNYRAAALTAKAEGDAGLRRQADRDAGEDRGGRPAALREAGFTDRDIWDIASTAAFFNMSNRVAAAVDMRPNPEYHAMARSAPIDRGHSPLMRPASPRLSFNPCQRRRSAYFSCRHSTPTTCCSSRRIQSGRANCCAGQATS